MTLTNDRLSAVLQVAGLQNETLRFSIFVIVSQNYITENGEYVSNELMTTINVNVVKASKVGAINTKIYNNKISFDIREMDYNETNGNFLKGTLQCRR